MPIHDYKCEDCGNIMFDIKTDSSITFMSCSECGSRNTYKTVSKFDFRLSGKGWAKDSYDKQ
jgi:putative FmdB family regulatory protein